MLLMVTAPPGDTVKFRFHERSQDKTKLDSIPFQKMTVGGHSISRRQGLGPEIELADGEYPCLLYTSDAADE